MAARIISNNISILAMKIVYTYFLLTSCRQFTVVGVGRFLAIQENLTANVNAK
jgi:hypothetical protein